MRRILSGGSAFVLDETGEFPRMCNVDMVDLESVSDDEDKLTLRRLLEAHYNYTGSANAERVLSAWEEILQRFTKVMPRDLKRVIAEQASSQDLEGIEVGGNG